MRVAFYAPMKPPDDPVPSGDRRLARALVAALKNCGHDVFLASRFRTYEGQGSGQRQHEIRRDAEREIADWLGNFQDPPPDLWFSYHVYHKSPDLLGPAISARLGIPYVIAEAMHAPKQMHGPWSLGHRSAAAAIRQADAVICVNPDDMECLRNLRADNGNLHYLRPFLERRATLQEISADRRHHLAARYRLDAERPWLVTTAMMRPGAKAESYKCLAEAVTLLTEERFHLLIAGDGPAAEEVHRRFAGESRATFLGRLTAPELEELYAAGDLFIWPAVREGFGMALLEAEAAGLPVVAGHTPGVASIVADNVSGLLTSPSDTEAFASAVRALLHDPARRRDMGAAARRKAGTEHSMERATAEIANILEPLSVRRVA